MTAIVIDLQVIRQIRDEIKDAKDKLRLSQSLDLVMTVGLWQRYIEHCETKLRMMGGKS